MVHLDGHEHNGECMGHGGDEELILEDLRAEDSREKQATSDAHELTESLLKQMGFDPEDIIESPSFEVISSDSQNVSSSETVPETVIADFLINIADTPLMAIKCTMALASRERHVLALARAVYKKPIPLCAVTDAIEVHVLRTDTGEVISTEKSDFPNKEELILMAEKCNTEPLDEKRRAKETQVLMAFEVTDCPRVKDK